MNWKLLLCVLILEVGIIAAIFGAGIVLHSARKANDVTPLPPTPIIEKVQ